MTLSPFASFFMGGFECSTHRRPSGRRIDVIDASHHDLYAQADYARLAGSGLMTARDGLRWHLIDQQGHFDFHSASAQVKAARQAGVQVIWDLMHYGYPDDLSPFHQDFPERFAQFARAATLFLRTETPGTLWLCPVNEISFMSWAGAEVAYMNPFVHGRGDELKAQLVRASVAAMQAAREVDPDVRFLHAEPLIHIRAHPETPEAGTEAQRLHEAQFTTLDWLLGRARPELGGGPQYVDVLGLNIYPYNQWLHHTDPTRRQVLPPEHPQFVPIDQQISAVYERYQLPLLIAETGTEDDQRAAWLRMVTTQALSLKARGLPLHGICLYPVVNHPGWDDDRHCHNGLWDYADEQGRRVVDEALHTALREGQAQLQQLVRQESGLPCGGQPVTLQAARQRLLQAKDTITGEAAARDRDGTFPLASFQALHKAQILTLSLPVELGGGGLDGVNLLEFLREVGQLSLPVGRLLEGHINALQLIVKYGRASQALQAAEEAAAGELFGVWNTEQAPGLRLEEGKLTGQKTFASGAYHVTRPLCPAETPQGRQLILLQAPEPERFDASFWQPAGMRATVSFSADLSGILVTPNMLIGPPGVYYAQPQFSGGALRFLAVQIGGAQAALHSARLYLRQIGRTDDDVQRLRFAAAAAALEGAWQTVREAQHRLLNSRHEDNLKAVLAYVSLARLLTEEACLSCAEACERAVGARGLLPPHPTERLLRDLRLYLRQPAPDAARLEVGTYILEADDSEYDPLQGEHGA